MEKDNLQDNLLIKFKFHICLTIYVNKAECEMKLEHCLYRIMTIGSQHPACYNIRRLLTIKVRNHVLSLSPFRFLFASYVQLLLFWWQSKSSWLVSSETFSEILFSLVSVHNLTLYLISSRKRNHNTLVWKRV